MTRKAPHPLSLAISAVLAMTLSTFSCLPAAQADDLGYGSRYRGRSGDYGYDSTYSLNNREQRYTPAVAGGVAAPSEFGIFGENAAGLIYTEHPGVLGFLGSGPDHPDLLSNGLSFQAGNGLAAASIGAQTYNNASDSHGSITQFNFGVATLWDALDTAVGLNGSYRFLRGGSNPSNDPTWTADLGFLYNPYGRLRLGFNLYNLSEGVTAGAVGLAANFNENALFSLDASTNNHGQGLTVKPGIAVLAASLSVSYAYGMQVDKSATSGITAGNTFGLGYQFNPTFRLQGYYNYVVPYYLAASIGF